MSQLPNWKDKALFTPGPLSTSLSVKQAMMRDLGSRDMEFIKTVRSIREKLVELGEGNEHYTTVLLPGSGTFGVEAVISSVIPGDGKLLIIINGAYGQRMMKIANAHKINVVPLVFPENMQPDVSEVEKTLQADPEIKAVAVVHCETTTGIINPIEDYGKAAKKNNCIYFVDAMSSFGAYRINLEECGIDYLVSSANKCIEGVPGFSFVIARRSSIEKIKGMARTLSLDLFAQWEGLETDGQFRFTPPTHVLLAFNQALSELDLEGGVSARGERYKQNYNITLSSMEKMGFKAYLDRNVQGYIITSFNYPDHPKFVFKEFYEKLSEKGHVIYPGKLSHADCFRIGHVGRLGSADVKSLMAAISETLTEMGVINL
ncbi:MAG: 2-aminoethylphosphonate--pyruvate transaminase [Chloroflexota bacterium]